MRRPVFDEDHESFRHEVRAFLTTEVVPAYDGWKLAGQPSREFWKQAGEVGILGIGVPTELGGLAGSDFRHSVVVTEEAQRLFLAMGGVRVHTDICMPYFLHYATEMQRERWLPRLASGDAVVALAMSEPGAGSDMKSMSTKAVRDGDDYIVDGAKTFISNGSAADLVILAVKTDPGAGRDGISLIVVETRTPGFTRGRRLDKLGLKAQDLAELSFVGMRVPVANRLGDEGAGFSMLTANLAQERLSIAVNSQAAARAALTTTAALLREHKPGQHAKFELASCQAEVLAGQALVDQAITLLLCDELDGPSAAAAKLYCTELQGRVAQRCLQVLPVGLSTEISDAFLDGRVSRIYGGSSEIMRVIVAQSLGL